MSLTTAGIRTAPPLATSRWPSKSSINAACTKEPLGFHPDSNSCSAIIQSDSSGGPMNSSTRLQASCGHLSFSSSNRAGVEYRGPGGDTRVLHLLFHPECRLLHLFVMAGERDNKSILCAEPAKQVAEYSLGAQAPGSLFQNLRDEPAQRAAALSPAARAQFVFVVSIWACAQALSCHLLRRFRCNIF